MIHLALKHVTSELNDYMQLRAQGLEPNPVVVGALLKGDGTPNDQTKEKIALLLVNLEEDRIYRSVETFSRRPDGTSEIVKPEVKLNLYLLFAANLAKYEEALKALSLVISFFQHRVAFDYSRIPGLEWRSGRIIFELFSPTFEQQNHLWGALGAKYIPSVLYKVGLLDIREDAIEGEAAPVQELSSREATG